MIVCHCEGVTDRDVKAALEAGAAGIRGVARTLNIGRDCGSCLQNLKALLQSWPPVSVKTPDGKALFYAA